MSQQSHKEFWPKTCHGRWMDPEYEEGLVKWMNRSRFRLWHLYL